MADLTIHKGVTPLHVQIAIHYRCKSAEPWPHLAIGVHRDYAEDLRHAGLLRAAGLSGKDYVATEGLPVWIDALCATPFPVQKWVMPEADNAAS